MQSHPVLRILTKLLLPFILLFALYVQFHGDFGPGGRFQAGVIFASGFILYTLVFDIENACRVASPGLIRILAACGVLLYGSVGIAGLLLGGQFLDYGILSEDSVHGQHLGILLIEAGVGITVAAVMIGLFYSFTSAGQSKE